MDEKQFDSINVIPLVDVMLVLLTIVLTTTTFIAVGAIPVELPSAENSNVESLQPITIAISHDGTIYLDQEQQGLPDLAILLDQKERTQPVLIRADRDIALQKFVNVMDIIKGLGFTQVSLQTQSLQ